MAVNNRKIKFVFLWLLLSTAYLCLGSCYQHNSFTQEVYHKVLCVHFAYGGVRYIEENARKA